MRRSALGKVGLLNRAEAVETVWSYCSGLSARDEVYISALLATCCSAACVRVPGGALRGTAG